MMRTALLFWLTFALAIFDVNAVLDSQGTQGAIIKLVPQIKTNPSAVEEVNQIDTGNKNKSSNSKNHQNQQTRKHENKMQLEMNDQHPVVKVLRTAHRFGSNPATLGVAKRRFMRRNAKTTPAQQPNPIMDLASTNLLVVDSSRQISADPSQKSKKGAEPQPEITNKLLDTQAVKLGDPNDAQQTIKQGGKPAVVELGLGSDTLITATPPGNVPGPVKLSPPPKKQPGA
ncbi:hypothetical protein INT45_009607 [Circinella minor]|uniref:Uncharacterized protein n=1 Tax=Circinella minor TaxID=1195481 RepID=A0A8H7S7D6_9FUNG|nr:hypothetical protein INT45_009607 [Circinella minor]